MPNLPELGKFILREQRQRDQDAVCRNGNRTAPVVVVRHPCLTGVAIVVNNAQFVDTELVDVSASIVGYASNVEGYNVPKNRVLRRLLRPFDVGQATVITIVNVPLPTSSKE